MSLSICQEETWLTIQTSLFWIIYSCCSTVTYNLQVFNDTIDIVKALKQNATNSTKAEEAFKWHIVDIQNIQLHKSYENLKDHKICVHKQVSSKAQKIWGRKRTQIRVNELDMKFTDQKAWVNQSRTW